MRHFQHVLVALVVVAAGLRAQTAHVAHWSGPCGVTVEDMELPVTGACAATVAQIPNYPAGAGCFTPTPFPFGAHALDQLHDLVYTSDGPTIHVSANPLYAANPCSGPFPGVQFAVPPVLTTFGTLFGPVTGMCVGLGSWTTSPSFPCPDVLWLTDGQFVMAIDPRPPFAVVVPPWFAPQFSASPFPILTGLEFDDHDNTIWATDGAGISYQYSVFGALLQGPIFPIPGAIFSNIIGNVLDRSTCPRQVWVTDGFLLYPVGGGTPVPLNTPASSLPCGASFSGEPLVMRGACGSTCSPTPLIGTTEPISSGMTALKTVSFTLTGAPAGTFALFAFDFVCMGPTFVPPTCLWWLNPSPVWFYWITTTTTGSGAASTPPLLLPPATCPGFSGLVGYAQWFFIDPCAISNVGVTDALRCQLSTL
jgi:hypothetical protein